MKNYKLVYFNEVKEDFLSLPNDVVKEAYEYIQKIKKNPYKYTQKLKDLGNIKLSGYRKTYFYNAKYRIISKIENGLIKIVKIVAIGKRKNKEVYYKAYQRIKNANNSN